MKTKQHDFIQLEYIGRITSTNKIFDTTNEEIAKENNIYNKNISYKPAIICIGEKQVVPGLDEFLEDKELNKEYSVTLPAEKAFGKKNPKLLQLIPTSKFRQNNINPILGLQINIDGMLGIIKSSGGGRSIVDFNHPLSGKEIIYTMNINKMITDTKQQLDSLIELYLTKNFISEIKEDIATIKFKNTFPKILTNQLSEKIKKLIPSIKKVEIESIKKKDIVKE